MTPTQVKAARLLLGWSRDRLAGASGVSAGAISVFENGGPVPATTPVRVAAIRAALELAGIEFTNGDNPGVNRRRGSR